MQEQPTTDAQQALTVPEGATLRLMKTYLPYVVILAQAFVIQNMYTDNRKDYRERIEQQEELSRQWHDAFFQTAGLLKNETDTPTNCTHSATYPRARRAEREE